MWGQLSMGATRRLNRHYQSQKTKHEYLYEVWTGGTVHRTPTTHETDHYKYKRVIISGYLPPNCFGVELNAGLQSPDIVLTFDNGLAYFTVTALTKTGAITTVATPAIPATNNGSFDVTVGGNFECIAEFDEKVFNLRTYQTQGAIAGIIYNFDNIEGCKIKVVKE